MMSTATPNDIRWCLENYRWRCVSGQKTQTSYTQTEVIPKQREFHQLPIIHRATLKSCYKLRCFCFIYKLNQRCSVSICIYHEGKVARYFLQYTRACLSYWVSGRYLSSKSCRNWCPCGKVMSSSPESTPIILFCSSVTPTIRATCNTTMTKKKRLSGFTSLKSLNLSFNII